MRILHGRRATMVRAAVITCAAVAAVAGTVAAAWPGQSGAATQHHTASLSRPSCGYATTRTLGPHTEILGADRGALRCFHAAARSCRSAGIEITVMGVDTGVDYIFLIEPRHGTCRGQEQSQAYSANFGGSRGSVQVTQCRRISVSREGVTLRCAGGTVLIPARGERGLTYGL